MKTVIFYSNKRFSILIRFKDFFAKSPSEIVTMANNSKVLAKLITTELSASSLLSIIS